MDLHRAIDLVEVTNPGGGNLIYHWADAPTALAAFKGDRLRKRKWVHYVPQVGEMLHGISFGRDAHTWAGEFTAPGCACFVVDRGGLSVPTYDINGAAAFNLTHALLNDPERAERRMAERGPDLLRNPDEVFMTATWPQPRRSALAR